MGNLADKSEVRLLDLLIDAYGYCDEIGSDVIYKIIQEKTNKLSNHNHPKAPYFQAVIPKLHSDISEAKYNALMEKSSNDGVAEAQYQYASRLYEMGKHNSAVKLYKVAADQGHPESQYCYGIDAYNGVGVEENKEAGLEYIELAAGQLYDWALEWLIQFYKNDASLDGIKKSQKYSKMLIWSHNK